MRLLNLTPALLLAAAASAKSWGGTNNYFLQSLSDEAQIAHIRELAAAGVKVIRLWVREQPADQQCEKGSLRTQSCPALEHEGSNAPDPLTLDLLDKTLLNIHNEGKGMKVILSPHDANSVYP